MSTELGAAIQEPDGRWAALCWECFVPDVIDGGTGYSTEAAAKTALRNHRRADHQEPPQPGTCRCHCGNVHSLTWPETRTGER